MSIDIKQLAWEDLSAAERENVSDNGRGKEYAAYLRVSWGGRGEFSLFSDAMEPEDAVFFRDLSWIQGAIRCAYNNGFSDGRAEAKNLLKALEDLVSMCEQKENGNYSGAVDLTEAVIAISKAT